MRILRPLSAAGLCLALFQSVLLSGPVPAGKPAHYPDWWFEQDVIARLNPNNTSPVWPQDYPASDDYATANLGQAKHLSNQAALNLEANLPEGLTPAIYTLINPWLQPSSTRDDYAALNQGQLKTVAKPFYDQFASLGYSMPQVSGGGIYPWTATNADDDSYALTNSGQLKYVFSFDAAAQARQLLVQSGDGQSAAPGQNLALPLKVKVVNRRGQAVAGTVVSYQIISGSGFLSASTSTSNAQGEASVGLTVTGAAGSAVRVRAHIPADNVEFVANISNTPTQGTGAGTIPPATTNPGANPGGDPDPYDLDPSPDALMPPWNLYVAMRTEGVPLDENGNPVYDPTEVTISWSYSGPSVDGFRIEMSQSGGVWNSIATPAHNIEKIHKSGLKGGVRYEFRIKSRRAGKNSIPSASYSYTPPSYKGIKYVFSQATGNKIGYAEYTDASTPPVYYLKESVTLTDDYDYEYHSSSIDECWHGHTYTTWGKSGSQSQTYSAAPNPAAGALGYSVTYSGSGDYNYSSEWYGVDRGCNDYDDSSNWGESASRNPSTGVWTVTRSGDNAGDPYESSNWLISEWWWWGWNKTESKTVRVLTINDGDTDSHQGYYSNWDRDGRLEFVLSTPYTTSAFKADVIASYNAYINWNEARREQASYRHAFQPHAYWYHADHNLSWQENGLKLGRVKYKVLAEARTDATQLNWVEIFVEDYNYDNPKEPEERYHVKQARSWTPAGAESGEFELDGATESVNGHYILQFLPKLSVPAGNGTYHDEEEKDDGVTISRSENGEAKSGFDILMTESGSGSHYYENLPGATYRLTWDASASEDFEVWADIDGVSTLLWNGYEFSELDEHKPYNFRVVALDGVDDGDDITLTLKITSYDGVVLTENSAKFKYVESNSYSNDFPADDMSGAKYRKVALNGAPLSDSKPQAAPESDAQPEETFVDAMTLALRHNVTDIYLPVEGSDFALSIRRNAASEVWNYRNGLRPHERPDLPFGLGWSSNVTPNIRMSTGLDGLTYAHVTDENGTTYRFLQYSHPQQGTSYFAFPTSKSDAAAYLATLDSGLTFRRKYGTTIYFTDAGISHTLPANRETGGSVNLNRDGMPVVTVSNTYERYHRAYQLTDKYGQNFTYEYSAGETLVPSRIYCAQRPDLQIRIRQNTSGHITSIWDAKDNETKFEYVSVDAGNGHMVEVLDKVIAADGGETTYDYDFVTETDGEPLPDGETANTFYHCDLSSITDPNGFTYGFAYRLNTGKYNYKASDHFTGHYATSGHPRQVIGTSLPGQAGATFDDQSVQKLNPDGLGGGLTSDSRRKVVVTDARGVSRTYTWTNPLVESLNEIPSGHGAKPKLIAYRTMTISHGTTGSETYTFDPQAGMALSSAVDMSGNDTSYAYTDAWTAPQAYRFLLPLTKGINGFYEDPTSQTNALGKVQSFTYQTGSRIMTSRTDELGNRTEWTVDGLGRRTEERVIPAGGSTPVQKTEFAYGNGTFPGFMTRKTVKKLTISGSPDPAWVADLVTDYVPDTEGRLWKEIVDPAGLALTTTHTYDLNGNKLTTTDPRGKVTKFFYDKRNRLKQVNYADGYNRQFFYDDRGNKIRELDEKGVATLRAYDGQGRVIAQALDLNNNGLIDSRAVDIVTSYTYTPLGAQETITDPRGTVTKFEYDSLNRLWHKTEDFGASPRLNYLTTYEYDLTKNPGGSAFDSIGWKPTKLTDARGFTTEVTYDDVYRPLQEKVQYKFGGYAITDKAYDDAGRLLTVTAPAAPLVDGSSARKVIKTVYDALGRATSVTDAFGTTLAATTTTAYTSTGLAHRVTDSLGRASDTEYDSAARAVKVFSPEVADGITGVRSRPVAETRYDANGNVAYTIDALGRRSDYTYDDRNRRTITQAPAVTDAISGVSSRPTLRTFYDPVGNPVAVQNTLGLVTDTEFDSARRPWKVTAPAVPLPDGTTARPVTETTYDAAGAILTVKDAKGRTTTNVYDALGRLKTTTDAASITVTYGYDAAGNRTDVWDGKNQRTQFAFDGLNRLTTTTDPASRVVTFEYDAVNKTARVDSENRRTEYKYDARHRLKDVKYIGRSQDDRSYTYDALNHILTVTEPGKGGKADVAYTYDELGRQATETSGGVQHTYGYDKTGNRTKVVYGGSIGTTLVSTYDALNRLETLAETTSGLSGTRTTIYGYDLGDRRVRQQLPSGEVVHTRYDALGRSTGSTTVKADGTPVLQLTQAHDLVGNVAALTEDHYGSGALPPRTVVNTYDNANRLFTETSAQGGRSTLTTYGYDAANNRSSRSVAVTYRGQTTTESTTYVYNNLNQLQTATVAGGAVTTYGYDFNGNRSSRSVGGQSDTYAYDYENRLVSLTKNTVGGAGSYAYVYDYRTRRVERTEAGTATKSVFSGGVSVADYVGATAQARYVRGSDWGGGVGGLLYSLRDGQPSYKHYNGRGDVVVATNSAATPTWRASYEAFGKRTAESGATSDRQKANTKEEDPTGLLNEGFRYRDLETGAFITRDPLGFVDGPNMYTYVVQNPWSKFDPEGLSWWSTAKSWGRTAVNFAGGFAVGAIEGTLGIDHPAASYGSEYTGRDMGRKAALAVGITLTAKGGTDMVVGGGAIAAGGGITVGTAGTGVIVGAPVALAGAAQVGVGAVETAIGGAIVLNSQSLNPIPGGPSARSVQEGDVGTYGDLKKRSQPGDGLDIHEVPSSAAQIAAKEKELGRKLTPKELKELKDSNPSIAIRRETHVLTDTYGGRNTPQKVAADADNLAAAAERGATDVVARGKETGVDLSKQAEELARKTTNP